MYPNLAFPHYYQRYLAKLGQWTLSIIVLTLSFSKTADAAGAQKDLPNFHVVHSYLLRGGEPSSKGLQLLKDMGVETIIDLRAPTRQAQLEKAEAKNLGMRYVNLPMSSRAPTEKQVSTFLTTIDNQARQVNETAAQNVGNKYPHSVFVHCAHGSDRTGCMVGIWRVMRDHWTYPQAYKEMRKYYFGPQYKELSQTVQIRASKPPARGSM